MRFATPYAAVLVFGSLWTGMLFINQEWGTLFLAVAVGGLALIWARRKRPLLLVFIWSLPILAFLVPQDTGETYLQRLQRSWDELWPEPTQEELIMRVAAELGYPKDIPLRLLHYYPSPEPEGINRFLCEVDLSNDFGGDLIDVPWLFAKMDHTLFERIEQIDAQNPGTLWNLDMSPEFKEKALIDLDLNRLSLRSLFLIFNFESLPSHLKEKVAQHIRQADWAPQPLGDRLHPRWVHGLGSQNPWRWLEDERYFGDWQASLPDYVLPDKDLLVPAAAAPSAAELDRIRERAPFYYMFLLAEHPAFEDSERLVAAVRSVAESSDPLLWLEFVLIHRGVSHTPELIEALGGLECAAERDDTSVLLDHYGSLDFEKFQKLGAIRDGRGLQLYALNGMPEFQLVAFLEKTFWFYHAYPPLESSSHESALDLIEAEAEFRCLTPSQVAKARLSFSKDWPLLHFLAEKGLLDPVRIRFDELLHALPRAPKRAQELMVELDPFLEDVRSFDAVLDEQMTEDLGCYLRACRDVLPRWYALYDDMPNSVPEFHDYDDSIDFSLLDDFGGDDFGGGGDAFGGGEFGEENFGVWSPPDSPQLHEWFPEDDCFGCRDLNPPPAVPKPIPSFAEFAGCERPPSDSPMQHAATATLAWLILQWLFTGRKPEER